MIKNTHLSYSQFGISVQRLVESLKTATKADGSLPWTHVVGIANGGLPAAVHVAKNLALPLLVYRPGYGLSIDRSLTANVDLLFVDDFFDSGKTTDKIISHANVAPYKKYHLTNKNFAFVYSRVGAKSANGFKPRYFGWAVTKQDGYLNFPWESTP